MASHRPEKGFTFISTIFMLFILALSLPFMGHLLQVIDGGDNYEELSIYQFFQFMRDDLIRSERWDINGKKLHLEMKGIGGRNASYEKYGNVIRRQVNGQGHEIYLQGIYDITFSPLPYGVKIKLTSQSGDEYEKTLILYEW